jgi:hypothetical protein
MKTCGAFHPDDMSITCSLDAHPHPVHIGGFPPTEWGNEDFVSPVRRHRAEGAKDFMARVASQVPSEVVFKEESPYSDL